MPRAYPERPRSLRNSQMVENGAPRRTGEFGPTCPHLARFRPVWRGRHSRRFKSLTTIPTSPDIYIAHRIRSWREK